jgi:hypothetical protein
MARSKLAVFVNGSTRPVRWEYTLKRACLGLITLGAVMGTGYWSATYRPVFIDGVAGETIDTYPSAKQTREGASVSWKLNLGATPHCMIDLEVFLQTASKHIERYQAFVLSQTHQAKGELNTSLADVQSELTHAFENQTSLQTSIRIYLADKSSCLQELDIYPITAQEMDVCGKLVTLDTQLEQVQAATRSFQHPVKAFRAVMIKAMNNMRSHWNNNKHKKFWEVLWDDPITEPTLYQAATEKEKAITDQILEECRQLVEDSEKHIMTIQELHAALTVDGFALHLVQAEHCQPEDE